jgi:predicted TIM-barrel fold metal-dependent hydrolase
MSALTSAGAVFGQSPAGTGPAFHFIDAHVHMFEPTSAFYDFLQRSGMRMVTVAYVDKAEPIYADAAKEHAWEAAVSRKSHGRVAWCSTFDAQDWESSGFASRTIANLEKTFDQGAVAVKMWKTIGMKLTSSKGEFVLPDNPAFRPILDTIAKHNKTMYAHIAEPISSWMPLEKMKPLHALYYGAHPEWHMYKHPGCPPKEALLAARDRMLEQHPNLRVVGCHLGSMEEDVADVAQRLDRYPNFAVDTAERIPDLMAQPRDKVRAFLIRYQDRVLYGTDTVWDSSSREQDVMQRLRDTYARDWKYLATRQVLELDGKKVEGLELPEAVLHKIYYENAMRWVPGLAAARGRD